MKGPCLSILKINARNPCSLKKTLGRGPKLFGAPQR